MSNVRINNKYFLMAFSDNKIRNDYIIAFPFLRKLTKNTELFIIFHKVKYII